MDPALTGEVVESEQFVDVVGELRDRLGPRRAVGRGKRLRGLLGVVAVFGVGDLRQRGLGVLVRRRRERGSVS